MKPIKILFNFFFKIVLLFSGGWIYASGSGSRGKETIFGDYRENTKIL